MPIILLMAVGVGSPSVSNRVGKASSDATNVVQSVKITSGTAYYDRKEGYAYFSDKVFVDDEEYKLHADRAYVFMDETNALKRVVALGHVAMTNGLRRASGDKASYYRQSGMVVLSGSDDTPAEVQDASKGDPQTVRGRKIRFWTTAQRVEVLEAYITAPRTGNARDSLKGVLGR